MAYSTRSMIGSTGGYNKAAYGGVPQQTAMPDPAGDLAKQFPNLTQANSAISENILNQLNAELSPDTISNIQDNAANFGVSSGMPGSQFSGYRGLRNLGLASNDLQNQGLENYLNATAGIKSTQTVSPETQIALNQSNATLASAPDPAAAALENERLFNAYLEKLSKQSASPSGGTSANKNMAYGWSRVTGPFSYDLNTGSGMGAYNELQGRIYSGL